MGADKNSSQEELGLYPKITSYSPKRYTQNPSGNKQRACCQTSTGQTGHAWAAWENSTRGKNSPFDPTDLPIHPMDSSETLGELGVPHGHPVAKRSSLQTHQIMSNRKSTLKNTSSRVHPKTTKSKAFR